jgi:hypothetical protein
MIKLYLYIKNLSSSNKYFRGIGIFLFALLIANTCFAQADDEYTEHCLNDKIKESSDNAGCWSCGIVFSLMVSLSDAAEKLYGLISAISEQILIYGGAIWIAIYLLKALGSFAAQTPGKVLDGLVSFMFKWALAYTAVVSGISAISDLIVTPLLDIGFTIGQSFADNASIGG